VTVHSYAEHAARRGNRAETSFDVIEFDLGVGPDKTVDAIVVIEHDLTPESFRTHVTAWHDRVDRIAAGRSC
jgi:hypothetical protein